MINPRILLFLLSALLLLNSGCGKKPVVESTPAEPVNPKPHWVQSKPASSIYFYGIGVATKQASNSDYLEVAKKNALNDLASEIKVNVSSNSILYTLERDYKFQSDFIETIRTSTDEDLEGFEVADSWEDERQYWVFYRLNRADYYAQKEAEKQAVLKNSADFYRSGLQAWKNGQVTAAFDLQIRALSLMKPYWAESNEFVVNDEEVLLDNAILGQLQNMANNIELAAHADEIVLNLDNNFSDVCRITASQKNSGEVLAGIPVLYHFKTRNGQTREERTTATNGTLNVSIDQPDLGKTYNELRANVVLEKLFDPRALDRDMLRLVRGLPAPEIKVPVLLERPVVFIESQEQNLQNREKLSNLRDHFSNEIIKAGLPVSKNRSDSDLIVQIAGNTRAGGESNGFSIAFLDMSFKMTDRTQQKIYFERAFDDLKGVSNTTERAGLRAFDKGKEKMDRRFMADLLDAVF